MSGKLAIDGGTPVRSDPFPTWPTYHPDEIAAVVEVLKSGRTHFAHSDVSRNFENRFAEYIGVKHAICNNSGTSAIHMALAAADVGPGDEVIVPPRTFIGTVSPVIQQNAVPVFADVDLKTHNISPDAIRSVITERTKAIIPVHLAGHPAEMDEIMQIAEEHGLVVIEDCAQAHGAEYKGRKVGSIGHINAFSFQNSKIITTAGDGGATTTDNDKYADICREFRNHGFMQSVFREPERLHVYIHPRMGYNYRMTEIQAAIGLRAMDRIEEYVEGRRANARYITDNLKDLDLFIPAYEAPHVRHSYYLYYAGLRLEMLKVDRDQFVKALKAEGILAHIGTSPELYKQEIFQKKVGHAGTQCPFTCHLYKGGIDYTKVHCPNAARLGRETFGIEVHPTAGPEDMADVVEAIRKVAEAYRR